MVWGIYTQWGIYPIFKVHRLLQAFPSHGNKYLWKYFANQEVLDTQLLLYSLPIDSLANILPFKSLYLIL